MKQASRLCIHLGLTPQGQKLMTKVLEGHAQRVQSLFAGLQSHEQEIMLGLLQRMEAHLHTLIAPPTGSVTFGMEARTK